MNQVSLITPISDDEAVRMARPETLADLASQITATPVPSAGTRRVRDASVWWRTRAGRRMLLGLPLTAAVGGAAALVLMLSSGPGTGQVTLTPQDARALSFTTLPSGGLRVIIRDPYRDPAVYRAIFAEHHLNITLQMIPASPSMVGVPEYIGGPLTPIYGKGPHECADPGSGQHIETCAIGVLIPANFHGSGGVAFGRAARPGEQYMTSGSAFAPGEAMHGMTIKGKTVAQVVAELKVRGVTVAYFNYDSGAPHYNVNVRQVPGNWYVSGAEPWAPNQMLLFVSAKPGQS
jgi:hypothetical protein